MARKKESPSLVAVLEVNMSHDAPAEVFVITLTKEYCAAILKLMAELSKRSDVHYFETFDYTGTYTSLSNILDTEDVEKIKSIAAENQTRTEVNMCVVSKSDVYWSACLKHSEPPIRLETCCVSRETAATSGYPTDITLFVGAA